MMIFKWCFEWASTMRWSLEHVPNVKQRAYVCVCVVCCAACDAAAVLCASQLSFQGHCRAEKWAVWASLHWASSLFALSYSVWCALNCVLRREVYLQCSTAPFSLLDWDVFMMSCDDVWWWFIATTEHRHTHTHRLVHQVCANECYSLIWRLMFVF